MTVQISQMLSELKNDIFDELAITSNEDEACLWHDKVLSAIQTSKNLSHIEWRLMHSILTDQVLHLNSIYPAANHIAQQSALVIEPLTRGEALDLNAVHNVCDLATDMASTPVDPKDLSAMYSIACIADITACAENSSTWSACSALNNSVLSAAYGISNDDHSDEWYSAYETAWKKLANKLSSLIN